MTDHQIQYPIYQQTLCYTENCCITFLTPTSRSCLPRMTVPIICWLTVIVPSLLPLSPMASLTRCYVLVPAGVSVYLIPDLMHVGFDHSFALDFLAFQQFLNQVFSLLDTLLPDFNWPKIMWCLIGWPTSSFFSCIWSYRLDLVLFAFLCSRVLVKHEEKKLDIKRNRGETN